MSEVNLNVSELVEYVTIVEAELDELREEIRSLRRSNGAFKANSTRRQNVRSEVSQTLSDLQVRNDILAQENSSLTNSIRAYKANATRRAARG